MTQPDHSQRSLRWSLAITLGFMAAEFVGGWIFNSLALLSDAGHMLTDAAALGLSLFALRLGQRPPSVTKTFGYRRFEILAALLNGLALWAIVGMILHEAYVRLQSPPAVKAGGMIMVAALGLVINLISVRLLHAHKDKSINVRGAFLHVVADSLGSVGALGAGLLIFYTGWTLADPLVSVIICALILWSSWGLVRDSVHVLLLGVPFHIDYREVEGAILALSDVCCVYDLHIWSITSGQHAVSAHVVAVEGFTGQTKLLHEIVGMFRQRFGIDHVTIQIDENHVLRDERLGPACRIDRQNQPCQGIKNGKHYGEATDETS